MVLWSSYHTRNLLAILTTIPYIASTACFTLHVIHFFNLLHIMVRQDEVDGNNFFPILMFWLLRIVSLAFPFLRRPSPGPFCIALPGSLSLEVLADVCLNLPEHLADICSILLMLVWSSKTTDVLLMVWEDIRGKAEFGAIWEWDFIECGAFIVMTVGWVIGILD
jgi:hypothetical protein